MESLIKKGRKKLEKIFKKEGVVLAYLFGSVTKGKIGHLSDVDIAVLFSEKVKKDDYFDKRLELASKIDKVLGTDKTEVVCLNQAPPLLKHQVVFYGVPIFVSNPELKSNFEVRSLQGYEDTKYLRNVVFKAMEERIKKGSFGKTPFAAKQEIVSQKHGY